MNEVCIGRPTLIEYAFKLENINIRPDLCIDRVRVRTGSRILTFDPETQADPTLLLSIRKHRYALNTSD